MFKVMDKMIKYHLRKMFMFIIMPMLLVWYLFTTSMIMASFFNESNTIMLYSIMLAWIMLNCIGIIFYFYRRAKRKKLEKKFSNVFSDFES